MHSTPKVLALRARPGCSDDTTLEESAYREMTMTESGITVVFKTRDEDEDSNQDSENNLFNVSPVDDGDISEEDDMSKKRKLSNSEGTPLAKTIRTEQENIDEKVGIEESKEKERVDAGIEEGENEGDLGFIPSARAGQARGPAETIDKDLEEVGQEQSGERQDMEELEEDHCEDDDDLENLGFTPPARQLAQPSPQTQNKTEPQILTAAENNDNVGDGHDVFDFIDEDEKDKAEKDKPDATQQTPPQEYRQRRQPGVEESWRHIGGVTPGEEKKGSRMDLRVLELLVHTMARDEGIDLAKEILKEDFFVRLVNKYGNVSGSARMASFTSPSYTLKRWREAFCTKVTTKTGKTRAGVHLFEAPQDKETPCRICNKETGEHMADPGQLASELQRATATTPDERQQCEHCQKLFKTRKTLNQHIKKLHPQEPASERGEKDGEGKRNVKDKRCERCDKVVGDKARHLKEFCRRNEDNLAECPHCKGMIVKTKLKEHIKGRLDKATGLMTKKGCEDKHSAGDGGPAMETCPICFKSVKVTYASRHRATFHGGEDQEKFKRKNEETEKPVKQGNPKQIYISRAFFLAALEEAQVKQVEQRSKEDPQPHEIQGLMVSRGLAFTRERGLNLRPPPRFVPRDGNCSYSTIALAKDPSLAVMGLHMEATHLRTSSIAWAIEMIRGLDEEGLQRVRLVATLDQDFEEEAEHLTRDELIQRLQRYAENGEYAGNLGDILLYVLSAFIQAPILVVDVNHANSPLGLFISPRTLFGTEPVTNVPYVAVRLLNHLEALLVPEDAKIPLQEMFAAQEAQEGPGNQISSGGSCGNKDGATGDKNEEGGSRPVESTRVTDTLPAPISTQGDRKTLFSCLPHLSPQFESRIRDLVKDLDSLYTNSPATVRKMEEAQREIQVLYAT